MPHCICYTSTALETEDPKSIQQMLKKIAEKNITNSISGILLHHQGNFLQILEGETAQLQSLYHKIKNDQRHKDVCVILDKPVKYRVFEGYKSNFTEVLSRDGYADLQRYVDQLDEIKVSKNRVNIIRNYLKSILVYQS